MCTKRKSQKARLKSSVLPHGRTPRWACVGKDQERQRTGGIYYPFQELLQLDTVITLTDLPTSLKQTPSHQLLWDLEQTMH